jgi:hypothetical protein
LLYVPYYILLILHAPNFWKWVIGPLFLYILERLYRFLSLFVGHGFSHIVDADVLPSRLVGRARFFKAIELRRSSKFERSLTLARLFSY